MYPTLTSVLHNEILEEMDSTQILKLQQQNELENQPVQLVQKTHILSKHIPICNDFVKPDVAKSI